MVSHIESLPSLRIVKVHFYVTERWIHKNVLSFNEGRFSEAYLADGTVT